MATKGPAKTSIIPHRESKMRGVVLRDIPNEDQVLQNYDEHRLEEQTRAEMRDNLLVRDTK